MRGVRDDGLAISQVVYLNLPLFRAVRSLVCLNFEAMETETHRCLACSREDLRGRPPPTYQKGRHPREHAALLAWPGQQPMMDVCLVEEGTTEIGHTVGTSNL